MAEHQDLPVDRVHAIECLLKLPLLLGPDRHFARARVVAQELRGERGRTRRWRHSGVDRDLPDDIPSLGSELSAMDELKPLECQEPQPEERRHRVRLMDVLRSSLGGLEKCLLDHVGGIDSSAQTLIEPNRDHPP